MKIEKYPIKKYDINKSFVFYSNNDLLIPFLKLLTKDFLLNNGLKLYFYSIKKGVVMDVFASITINNHEQLLNKLEKLIEETFNTTIKEVVDLIKLEKLRK